MIPGTPKALPRTTLAVLRPTPGSVTRSSSLPGTSPSNRSTSAAPRPISDDRLVPEEAGRPDQLLQLGAVGARVVGGGAVAGEQRRGDQVDPPSVRLRGQDDRDDQLERVGEVELAVRVRVGLGQHPRHPAGPADQAELGFRLSSRCGHGSSVVNTPRVTPCRALRKRSCARIGSIMTVWFVIAVPIVIMFFALFMERVEARLRHVAVQEDEVEEFLEQARPGRGQGALRTRHRSRTGTVPAAPPRWPGRTLRQKRVRTLTDTGVLGIWTEKRRHRSETASRRRSTTQPLDCTQ